MHGAINHITTLDPRMILSMVAVWLKLVAQAAQTYTAANYLFLIERRYRLVFSVLEHTRRDYHQYQSHGLVVRGIENTFTSKLQHLSKLFREVTEWTKQFDEIFGWIFATQMVKSFTMISFAMYFLCVASADDEWMANSRNPIINYTFVFMTCDELMKMIVTAIAIHSVLSAVKFTRKLR